MTTGFQLRAPWYDRERRDVDLNDLAAFRPVIQMYADTEFVEQITTDPGVSVEFGEDDVWSYPAPVAPSITAKGRDRFVTSRLVTTTLRKLYQPAHSRFYAVVVEVFCDQPGLPRAGHHRDIQVGFVMRRQHTCLTDERGPIRKLAKELLAELAKEQYPGSAIGTPDTDVRDVWFADQAARRRFVDDHPLILENVGAKIEEQAWMVGAAGGQWRPVGTAPAADRPEDHEELLPMWRLPPREGDCDAASSRSLWFGLIPTYSADHWVDPNHRIQQKLDDHAIYQLRCVVTRARPDCPPLTFVSDPTEPFRLAAAYDPDGTKNHAVTVTAPDLRRLAARAGRAPGPGGLRIVTPPKSGLSPVDFKAIPAPGIGKIGGGQICTFAFELFFMVALFLFVLFLPIVVLVFQLWFLLALRFCIPPSLSFKVVADFLVAGTLLDIKNGVSADAIAAGKALDEVMGIHDAAATLLTPTVPPDPESMAAKPDKIADLMQAVDPKAAVRTPVQPTLLRTPPDPLCPVD